MPIDVKCDKEAAVNRSTSEKRAKRSPWWTGNTAAVSLGIGGIAVAILSLRFDETDITGTYFGWRTAAFFVGVSFITGYLLTWLARGLAPQLGLIDVPKGRKCHASPTPLMGGVAV